LFAKSKRSSLSHSGVYDAEKKSFTKLALCLTFKCHQDAKELSVFWVKVKFWKIKMEEGIRNWELSKRGEERERERERETERQRDRERERAKEPNR
jgi:hypothetical protein